MVGYHRWWCATQVLGNPHWWPSKDSKLHAMPNYKWNPFLPLHQHFFSCLSKDHQCRALQPDLGEEHTQQGWFGTQVVHQCSIVLIPSADSAPIDQNVHLGIGCVKDTSQWDMEKEITQIFPFSHHATTLWYYFVHFHLPSRFQSPISASAPWALKLFLSASAPWVWSGNLCFIYSPLNFCPCAILWALSFVSSAAPWALKTMLFHVQLHLLLALLAVIQLWKL